MFSVDYLIKESFKSRSVYIFSIFTHQQTIKTESFSKRESSKSVKQKKSFDFPFTNFLSS